jgi:hemerythrin
MKRRLKEEQRAKKKKKEEESNMLPGWILRHLLKNGTKLKKFNEKKVSHSKASLMETF